MEPNITQQFIDTAKKLFQFLVDDFCFMGPFIEKDRKTDFLNIYYMSPKLALEIILDCRELDIDCKFLKIINGKKTTDYSKDQKGNLVRISVADLLREQGIRDKLFSKIGHLPVTERIPIILNDYVLILKKYCRKYCKEILHLLIRFSSIGACPALLQGGA